MTVGVWCHPCFAPIVLKFSGFKYVIEVGVIYFVIVFGNFNMVIHECFH